MPPRREGIYLSGVQAPYRNCSATVLPSVGRYDVPIDGVRSSVSISFRLPPPGMMISTRAMRMSSPTTTPMRVCLLGTERGMGPLFSSLSSAMLYAFHSAYRHVRWRRPSSHIWDTSSNHLIANFWVFISDQLSDVKPSHCFNRHLALTNEGILGDYYTSQQ